MTELKIIHVCFSFVTAAFLWLTKQHILQSVLSRELRFLRTALKYMYNLSSSLRISSVDRASYLNLKHWSPQSIFKRNTTTPMNNDSGYFGEQSESIFGEHRIPRISPIQNTYLLTYVRKSQLMWCRYVSSSVAWHDLKSDHRTHRWRFFIRKEWP